MRFKDQLLILGDETVNNLQILIRLIESKNIDDRAALERLRVLLSKVNKMNDYIALN